MILFLPADSISYSYLFCHFLFLSAFYLFSSFSRFHFINERILLRSSSSFSLIRLFRTYFARALSLSLTRFSISFCSLFHSTWRHFCPRTSRLVTSFPFFLAIPAPCGRIFVPFYFCRLHFSFSFDAYVALCPFRVVRTVASFIVFAPRCPPYSCVAAAALSRFSTHVNARSLIFLSSLFLAFVPPSARAIRYVTFSVFLFGMYAQYPIRDPFYLDIVLFCRTKCILRASLVFSLFFLFFLSYRVYSTLPLPVSPQIPDTSLLRSMAILENTIRSIPSHYPR